MEDGAARTALEDFLPHTLTTAGTGALDAVIAARVGLEVGAVLFFIAAVTKLLGFVALRLALSVAGAVDGDLVLEIFGLLFVSVDVLVVVVVVASVVTVVLLLLLLLPEPPAVPPLPLLEPLFLLFLPLFLVGFHVDAFA